MSLRGWSWDAVAGPAGLGDRPLPEALEAAQAGSTSRVLQVPPRPG